MISFCIDIVINRPVETVFAFVSDGQNARQWNPELLEAKPLSDGPMGVGTKFQMTYLLPIGRVENVHEVLEYKADECLAVQIISSQLPINYRCLFTPSAGGTQLSLTTAVKTDGMAAMLAPLVVPRLKQRLTENLNTLKKLLEASV
jgi:hypothetical protein